MSQFVCEWLRGQDYFPEPVFDGRQVLEKWHESSYQLIILDMVLPGIGGLEVLKEIRESSNIPIVILTALADEKVQLASFDCYISDYIIKPFSTLVLIKRLENILRSLPHSLL